LSGRRQPRGDGSDCGVVAAVPRRLHPVAPGVAVGVAGWGGPRGSRARWGRGGDGGGRWGADEGGPSGGAGAACRGPGAGSLARRAVIRAPGIGQVTVDGRAAHLTRRGSDVVELETAPGKTYELTGLAARRSRGFRRHTLAVSRLQPEGFLEGEDSHRLSMG